MATVKPTPFFLGPRPPSAPAADAPSGPISACISADVVVRPYDRDNDPAAKSRFIVFNQRNNTSLLTNTFGKQVVEALLSDIGATLDAPAVQAILSRQLGKPVPLAPVIQMLTLLYTTGITLTSSEDLVQHVPRVRRVGMRFFIRLIDLDFMIAAGKPFWWHPAVFATLLLLGALGIVAIIARYSVGGNPLPDIANIAHLPIYDFFLFIAANYIMTSIHEMCHAFPCKRYGAKLGFLGVMLGPTFGVFVDTNGVYLLPTRRTRITVSLAGPLATLTMTGFLCLGLAFTAPGSHTETLLFTIVVWSLATLLLCLIPFGRDDGYYILSEIAGEVNLAERARAYVFSRLLRRPYVAKRPPRPRLYWTYLIGNMFYGLLTLALFASLIWMIALMLGW